MHNHMYNYETRLVECVKPNLPMLQLSFLFLFLKFKVYFKVCKTIWSSKYDPTESRQTVMLNSHSALLSRISIILCTLLYVWTYIDGSKGQNGPD